MAAVPMAAVPMAAAPTVAAPTAGAPVPPPAKKATPKPAAKPKKKAAEVRTPQVVRGKLAAVRTLTTKPPSKPPSRPESKPASAGKKRTPIPSKPAALETLKRCRQTPTRPGPPTPNLASPLHPSAPNPDGPFLLLPLKSAEAFEGPSENVPSGRGLPPKRPTAPPQKRRGKFPFKRTRTHARTCALAHTHARIRSTHAH